MLSIEVFLLGFHCRSVSKNKIGKTNWISRTSLSHNFVANFRIEMHFNQYSIQILSIKPKCVMWHLYKIKKKIEKSSIASIPHKHTSQLQTKYSIWMHNFVSFHFLLIVVGVAQLNCVLCVWHIMLNCGFLRFLRFPKVSMSDSRF